MPRMDVAALMADAPPNVRLVPRFVADAELPAYFARADLVVLPYREIEQSGVLFTALAFGKPLLVSRRRRLRRARRARRRARRARRATPRALHDALPGCWPTPPRWRRSASGAGAAARGDYGWRPSPAARSRSMSAAGWRSPACERAFSPVQNSLSDFAVFVVVRDRTARYSMPSSPASNARIMLGATRIASSREIVDDLVVQAHAPAARKHDVDLLGLVVAVAERLALARPEHLVGNARVLGVQLFASRSAPRPSPRSRTSPRCLPSL